MKRRMLPILLSLALCLSLLPTAALAAEEDPEIPTLDGYMETEDFIDKYLPETMIATNGTDTQEVEVGWEIQTETYEKYIPSASKYSFRPKPTEKLPNGYELKETGSRWIEVGQSMVQIYLGCSDCEYDEKTQTIKKNHWRRGIHNILWLRRCGWYQEL